jgi:hypothetical protein
MSPELRNPENARNWYPTHRSRNDLRKSIKFKESKALLRSKQKKRGTNALTGNNQDQHYLQEYI